MSMFPEMLMKTNDLSSPILYAPILAQAGADSWGWESASPKGLRSCHARRRDYNASLRQPREDGQCAHVAWQFRAYRPLGHNLRVHFDVGSPNRSSFNLRESGAWRRRSSHTKWRGHLARARPWPGWPWYVGASSALASAMPTSGYETGCACYSRDLSAESATLMGWSRVTSGCSPACWHVSR